MSRYQKTSEGQKSLNNQTERFLQPLLKNRAQKYRIENVRNGRILAECVAGAFDSKSRRTGLLHETDFPEGRALIIAPSNGIHTFFMRFPIDVAFISRSGRVVKACRCVRPWRIALALRAYAVIELPAGTLESCDTRAGDSLTLTRSTSTPD